MLTHAPQRLTYGFFHYIRMCSSSAFVQTQTTMTGRQARTCPSHGPLLAVTVDAAPPNVHTPARDRLLLQKYNGTSLTTRPRKGLFVGCVAHKWPISKHFSPLSLDQFIVYTCYLFSFSHYDLAIGWLFILFRSCHKNLSLYTHFSKSNYFVANLNICSSVTLSTKIWIVILVVVWPT